MDINVKLIWIDALTSDEYKQGYKQLKNDKTYCCLGVLCDLYIKETGKGYWSLDGFRSEDAYSPMNNILPLEVSDWAGLKSQNPSFCNNNVTLIEINDNGTSFREIAKIIEKEL